MSHIWLSWATHKIASDGSKKITNRLVSSPTEGGLACDTAKPLPRHIKIYKA